MEDDVIINKWNEEFSVLCNKKILAALRGPFKEIIAEVKKFPDYTAKRLKDDPQEDPQEEEEGEKEESVVKTFKCAGRVWEDPPIPCPGGPKAYKKAGIMFAMEPDGPLKKIVVCHQCKLARNNRNKKLKKNE